MSMQKTKTETQHSRGLPEKVISKLKITKYIKIRVINLLKQIFIYSDRQQIVALLTENGANGNAK